MMLMHRMTDGEARINRGGIRMLFMPTVWAIQFSLDCPFIIVKGEQENDGIYLSRFDRNF